MRNYAPLLCAATVVALVAGCGDAGSVLQPNPSTLSATRSADAAVRRIEILDACDPLSFDAAIGAGTCSRPGGGVAFSTFIDQLTRSGTIGAWTFAPSVVNAPVGATLLATNRGGETHTFTEVEDFGGGIVPLLNQITGNTTVAPECQALTNADFIAPGGTKTDEVEEAGVEKYQCCIHPWMRVTVVGRG